MSFSFSYIAENKAAAQQALVKAAAVGHVPESVEQFVREAIGNISPDQAISVEAAGHLCGGLGSYARSDCKIVVNPISIYREVMPELGTSPQRPGT